MVFLTILSTIPMYISVRTNVRYGILSYFCAALLLLFISPHQAIFFACTNGLVGTSLGVCREKMLNRTLTCVIGAALLLAGLVAVGLLLGVMQNVLNSPLVTIVCVLFCMIYSLFCDWILEKIYRLIRNRNQRF